MRLPLHILAVRRNCEGLFSEEAIHERWGIAFYRSQRFLAINRPTVSIALQPNHRSQAMSEAQKCRELSNVLRYCCFQVKTRGVEGNFIILDPG